MHNLVCIPTAGTGSRLHNLTSNQNKSLITVANKPVISHIIEKFPLHTHFVIILGFKGNLVKEFLEIAYPKRNFIFTSVDLYEGPGSGLGRSLMTAKKFLNDPFIFCSCDTIVKEKIPFVDKNWLGYSDNNDCSSYRTLSISTGQVLAINEKNNEPTNHAYIGLAGIYDTEMFWEGMNKNLSIKSDIGEIAGMKSLFKSKIYSHKFTWYDTGQMETLNKARASLKKKNAPQILEKPNESIWFIENNVIKYSSDQKFINNRVLRSKFLGEYIPRIKNSSRHFYSYEEEQGEVISSIMTEALFEKFLKEAKKFWVINKDKLYQDKFFVKCKEFYLEKTKKRVGLFNEELKKFDAFKFINDKKTEPIEKIIHKLNWEYIYNGVAGNFHGDFHFENIIYQKKKDKFIFLDWRQDFGGEIKYGDIYYDFAKLLHGMIINHKVINNGNFVINIEKEHAYFDFYRLDSLIKCEKQFISWLKENHFDVNKVIILTALIFINIAPLHHSPYNQLLLLLGKSMLGETINSENKNLKI